MSEAEKFEDYDQLTGGRAAVTVLALILGLAAPMYGLHEHLNLRTGAFQSPTYQYPILLPALYLAMVIGTIAFLSSLMRLRRAGVLWRHILAIIAFVAAFAAGTASLLAGFGYQWEWWSLEQALFGVLPSAVFVSLYALLLVFFWAALSVTTRSRSGLWPAGMAAVIALVTFLVPFNQSIRARSLPPIHDITTDMAAPPEFVNALSVRLASSANPATYAGDEIADMQAEFYPDIQPIILRKNPKEVLSRSLRVIKQQGWEVIAVSPQEGRIEAVDTTFWFGFKDDVVIRVRPVEGGTRVDIRSKSRIGVSDLGTNADRIRRFSKALLTER